MSDTPKCTSWLGHRFRARYSVEPFKSRNAELQALALVNKDVVRTYERDVCERCGWAIERHIEITGTPEAS